MLKAKEFQVCNQTGNLLTASVSEFNGGLPDLIVIEGMQMFFFSDSTGEPIFVAEKVPGSKVEIFEEEIAEFSDGRIIRKQWNNQLNTNCP